MQISATHFRRVLKCEASTVRHFRNARRSNENFTQKAKERTLRLSLANGVIKTELRPRLLLGSQRPQRVGWSAKPWAAAAWRHQVRADEARAAGFSWEIRRFRTFVEAAGAWRYSSARDVPAGLSAKEVSLACIVWLRQACGHPRHERAWSSFEGWERQV